MGFVSSQRVLILVSPSGGRRIEFWTLGLLSVSSALLRFGKSVVLDCRGPRGAMLLPVDDPYASHRRVYGLSPIVPLIIYLSNLASLFFIPDTPNFGQHFCGYERT